MISVITVRVQQYITFNILGRRSSQLKPEAIKGGINAPSQNTVTALLSLDIGGLAEPPAVWGAHTRSLSSIFIYLQQSGYTAALPRK